MMHDVKTTFIPDDLEDKLHVKYEYDAEPVLNSNRRERNAFTTFRSAPKVAGMVKVASLHPGDVQRLANLGYDITSPDPEEVKRALLFIQAEQKNLLTVNGKPIAKKKLIWT